MQRSRDPALDLVGDPFRIELTDQSVRQVIEERRGVGLAAPCIQLGRQLIDALLEIGDPGLVERCDSVLFPRRLSCPKRTTSATSGNVCVAVRRTNVT